MSHILNLRRATRDDAQVLAEFARQTFIDTYAEFNDAENMRQHCEIYFGEAQQAAEIARADCVFLLAYQAENLVGFAQVIARAQPNCVNSPTAICLYRYYVDKAWHGKGIAQALLDAALSTAREMGYQQVWLTAWEHNPRAIAFYRKAGFTEVGATGYPFGTEVQRDLVFIKSVDSFCLA